MDRNSVTIEMKTETTDLFYLKNNGLSEPVKLDFPLQLGVTGKLMAIKTVLFILECG